MKAFQLVELEGYNDILFSASSVFPDQLYKFNGGEKLAFYDIYELMPIMPPLKPIVRGIYDKGKLYPIDVDFEKEKVSFNLKNEGNKVSSFCSILVNDIDELLVQLDLYLMYYSIGVDLNSLKENIKPIFDTEPELIIANLFNEDEEEFSLVLRQYNEKVLFVLRKEF